MGEVGKVGEVGGERIFFRLEPGWSPNLEQQFSGDVA